jgi:F-type H+-transporting ATPase subunit epsilon
MNTFKLTIASPDGNKFSGDVYKLDVRGTEGELAIMAGHIPFTTSLVNAPCVVWFDEATKKTAVSKGGLLNVGTDSVTLLSGSFKFND